MLFRCMNIITKNIQKSNKLCCGYKEVEKFSYLAKQVLTAEQILNYSVLEDGSKLKLVNQGCQWTYSNRLKGHQTRIEGAY